MVTVSLDRGFIRYTKKCNGRNKLPLVIFHDFTREIYLGCVVILWRGTKIMKRHAVKLRRDVQDSVSDLQKKMQVRMWLVLYVTYTVRPWARPYCHTKPTSLGIESRNPITSCRSGSIPHATREYILVGAGAHENWTLHAHAAREFSYGNWAMVILGVLQTSTTLHFTYGALLRSKTLQYWRVSAESS